MGELIPKKETLKKASEDQGSKDSNRKTRLLSFGIFERLFKKRSKTTMEDEKNSELYDSKP